VSNTQPLRAIALALVLLACEASYAHDPSAYGGLFRTRNWGENWLNADVGLFLGAAVALAINPADPNHLLLGTDAGLLVSRNGGRLWQREAPDRLFGAVFAVAFLQNGRHAVCATPGGVYRYDGSGWNPVTAPSEAAPARAIQLGSAPSRMYLIGRRAPFSSEDAGVTWKRIEHDLPGDPEFTELVVGQAPSETLYAVVDGRLMASGDQGLRWRELRTGTDGLRVEGLSLDPAGTGRMWVAAGDYVYRSDDAGASWRRIGSALPEAGTSVRGIAADPDAARLIAATHRGLYRSVDAGGTWRLLEDNLPVHLESRPLTIDRAAPGTVYAGFALMPYAELWRSALEGGSLLSRVDPVSLAGGLAFLLLIILLGVLGARWLLHRAARGGLRASKP
jgi:photosystem II stability/assembly factor-like uncharacterized protein